MLILRRLNSYRRWTNDTIDDHTFVKLNESDSDINSRESIFFIN